MSTDILSGISSVGDLPLIPLEGRRVFLRVDCNVPLADDGRRIEDDTRIREVLPTLKLLIEQRARIVIGSHLGRPEGVVRPELTLEPVGLRLAELLSREVILTDDCVGDGARKVVLDLRDGDVVLLENLRFHAAEEQNDEAFARELARFADIYVNDAFGVSHRAHASVSALPAMVPARAMGLLLKKEVEGLGRLLALGPEDRPFMAVLGGAKVSDKIAVLESLIGRAQALLIGGAMANTFLAAQGHSLGRSRVEKDRLPIARDLLRRAREADVDIVLPVDLMVADGPEASAAERVPVGEVPADRMALDIGPNTVARFRDRLLRARTVFWNGPMGVFEKEPFAKGTMAMARAIAECGAFSVVGGGDSVAAAKRSGVAVRFGHVSTGGGASLELIEGRKLPGIEALRVS